MRDGIWKGSISFGLLNIPVTLKSADEAKEIHFSMLEAKTLSPIHMKRVNNKGKEVKWNNLTKGYQYKPGKFVVMDEKDFKAANVKATQEIDIEDFVSIDDIDPMLFEKPYYLVPQKAGMKGYFLLREALSKTGKVAIAKIVIRVRQRLVAIMAKGDYLVLEILRFAHEVKEIHEVDYLSGVETHPKLNPRELKMAMALVDGMTAKWEPDKYKDTYYNDLMKRIKAKIKNGPAKVLEDEEPEEKAAPSTSRVIDLMPLLKKSLEQKAGKRKRSAA